MNRIKKELFETFEDLKDVTINGETFKARGKMVFLTSDNKELEKAVEEKGLIPYIIAGDTKETTYNSTTSEIETVEEPNTEEKPKPKKVVKNASTGKNK